MRTAVVSDLSTRRPVPGVATPGRQADAATSDPFHVAQPAIGSSRSLVTPNDVLPLVGMTVVGAMASLPVLSERMVRHDRAAVVGVPVVHPIAKHPAA